jgi:hypothetical protein
MEAKSVQVPDALFDPMGKHPGSTPRWANDADRIASL